MKNLFMLIILLLSASVLVAEPDKTLSGQIRYCIDEISYSYAERNPGLVSRQGAAILEIKENGDRVSQNKLGILIETYIEEQMDNSIVFYLVDRKNLDEILQEQSLSLSGLIDEATAPEIGEISGISVFLSGEVIEEGRNFKVSVKLTDASTAEVIDTYSFSIDGKKMIDASLDLQYSYVAENGIGISLGSNYLITQPANFNQQTILQLFNDLSAKYRISKEFMFEVGMWLPMISKTDSYYVHPADFTYGDIQPDLTNPLAADNADQRAVVQSIWLSHVDAQFTFNFSPQFNLGIKLGWIFSPDITVRLSTNPYHLAEAWNTAGTTQTDSIVLEEDEIDLVFNHLHGVRVELAPEFFITPRFAVNAAIGYIYTLPADVFEVRIGTRKFESSGYYGYDPTLMPDGTPWVFDFSAVYGGVSVSVFF